MALSEVYISRYPQSHGRIAMVRTLSARVGVVSLVVGPLLIAGGDLMWKDTLHDETLVWHAPTNKLEKAAKQTPKNPQVHGMLGLLYHRIGDDKLAEKEYRTALELAPGDPEQLNNYAIFLCSVGRADEGVSRFEEAAKNPLYRTPWAAYTNAGVCLRSAKRDADARSLFLRANQVNPNFAEAIVQLADLDLADHQPADAYRRTSDYLKTNPTSPDILLLGWRAAHELKDPVGAAQMAWRMQSDFPDSDQAHTLARLSAGKN